MSQSVSQFMTRVATDLGPIKRPSVFINIPKTSFAQQSALIDIMASVLSLLHLRHLCLNWEEQAWQAWQAWQCRAGRRLGQSPQICLAKSLGD